jgi:hypothetical protein
MALADLYSLFGFRASNVKVKRSLIATQNGEDMRVVAYYRWSDKVLSIHRDVLEAYLSELGTRRAWADNQGAAKTTSVEYDGTVTETAESDPWERIVVARWSIDLIGQIHIKLLEPALPQP